MARGSSTTDRITDTSLCTCANLRMASRAMTQAYDKALSPAGLKTTQFTLMVMLEELGQVPLTQLAEKLVMDRTTLTRNLQPLIDRGLIAADRGQDRRVRNLSVSREGSKVLKKARPRWEKVQLTTVSGLGPDHWQRLLDQLAIATSMASAAES